MRTNTEYKNAALAALKGHWAPAVLFVVLLSIVVLAIAGPQTFLTNTMDPADTTVMPALFGIMGGSLLVNIFLSYPLAYIGNYNAFRLLYENGDSNIIGNGFSLPFKNYLHNVWVVFLMTIKIFLWALLFVIPGIYKALCYSMTPFIAVEHPELSAKETIEMSRQMMKGHVFDLIWLYLSFIGWALLCIVTLGIGFFWLAPYVNTSVAAFYSDLKAEYLVGNSEA